MNEKGEEIQPNLIDLPKFPKEIEDFLTPDGKKISSIPTGMTKKEKNGLSKNRPKSGPAAIGADDWAKK